MRDQGGLLVKLRGISALERVRDREMHPLAPLAQE
jgi:hypothetical protein